MFLAIAFLDFPLFNGTRDHSAAVTALYKPTIPRGSQTVSAVAKHVIAVSANSMRAILLQFIKVLQSIRKSDSYLDCCLD